MGYCIYQTPLGQFRVEFEDESITAAYFLGAKQPAKTIKEIKVIECLVSSRSEKQISLKAACWLDVYFFSSGKKTPLLKLKPNGTPFQLTVWKKLCAIKRGKCLSYQGIAQQIGKPKAARAIGQACGKNPICLFVPCHRVIASNSTLGGYSAGLWRKLNLLAREGIIV